MKKVFLRVLIAWIAFEAIQLIIAPIFGIILGYITPFFIDRGASSAEDMKWMVHFLHYSNIVLAYLISFIAFISVSYVIVLKNKNLEPKQGQ